MGDTTQGRSLYISPSYTADFWRGLDLNPEDPKQEDWLNAVDVLRDRIDGRFIKPAQTLIETDKGNKQQSFGFAILALDCLVLETIQGFRDGLPDHNGQSKRLFVDFLSGWRPFVDCLGEDMLATAKAESFYKQGRCALHHSGATDKLRVRIGGPMMSFEGDEITVNRTAFHAELVAELGRYLIALSDPQAVVLRRNFQRKMNTICGI